jgi:UDP-N-acetylmuramate dehydrogenase
MNKPIPISIQHNISLKPFNTFGMDVKSAAFVEITSEAQLPALLKFVNTYNGPVLFLGGGSNILFTGDFDGLVVHIATRGIEIVDEDEDYVYVRGNAGENWNDFVQFCVRRNYGGLENLSLIPGNVGSAPIQNIGAYGVEIKDTFYMLDAVAIRSGEFREFYSDECDFGYRHSIFKTELKGSYIILSVTFRLHKNPELSLSYGSIRDQMNFMGLKESVQSVAEAVISIRQSKLPDPLEIGNAGSFFKNPVISTEHFNQILALHPGIPSYPADGGVKLAAGWLIEKCGWRGYRDGDAGVHEKQALVLVNYGSANGTQILDLANKIIASVKTTFDVDIEPEVNIL